MTARDGSAIVAKYRAGEISAAIALMELLILLEDPNEVGKVVRATDDASLARLFEENAPGCARIAGMLASGMDSSAPAASTDEGIAFCTRLFDYSVQESEEASVALYSLGSPEILAQATGEIVAWLERRNVLGPSRRVLQIGCGIGRLERALAPRVAEAYGIDVSSKMIEAARRRCAGIANVKLEVTSGRDLSAFEDGRFEVVYAVDSFPYLVQSGMELVRLHFAEAARVLTPGGDFIILNFSYGGLARDKAAVRALGAAGGFDALIDGETPFRLWDGAAFHLRRR